MGGADETGAINHLMIAVDHSSIAEDPFVLGSVENDTLDLFGELSGH